MLVTIKNNFETFKNDFKKDTKLDANSNMAIYVNYITARCADYSMQMSVAIYKELDLLPQYVANKLATLLKQH